MTEESPSAWALLPLPGQSTAAAYLTGPLAKPRSTDGLGGLSVP